MDKNRIYRGIIKTERGVNGDVKARRVVQFTLAGNITVDYPGEI